MEVRRFLKCFVSRQYLTVNMRMFVLLAAEKKEESESEEDDDLGFGLFD